MIITQVNATSNQLAMKAILETIALEKRILRQVSGNTAEFLQRMGNLIRLYESLEYHVDIETSGFDPQEVE